MTTKTIDDVSSVAEIEPAVPGIVMVTSGRRATNLMIVLPAELGRQITAGGTVHEIDDERMSRDHAKVSWERGQWVIADRESRNGTFVDGDRISGEVRRRGDVVVRLGHTVFVLLADSRGQPGRDHGTDVVGPELARVYDAIRRHAAETLLIHGESGTGKELAARLYHDAGPRRMGPFVAVNCAAIPEGVAERLLFGAKKGAFSGAIDALGHFQMAAGGTLFLDEVAELGGAVQAKLLRVLETREIVPVGATNGVEIDVGIVAASHRELRAAVADRQFRDDLYYRLARVTVHLPPLRERKVDIAQLVHRELSAIDRKLAPHAKLVEACCLRPWPGNVRELRGAVSHAANEVRAAGRDLVRVEDLGATAGASVGSDIETASERPKPLPVNDIDKAAIIAALAEAKGKVSVAARALGLHRTQLYRLIDKHRLARDDT